MHTTIGEVSATEVYAIDDGFLAIEQAGGAVVLLAPDELHVIIKELQAHYDRRAQWQEPIRG